MTGYSSQQPNALNGQRKHFQTDTKQS